ncbi:MAG: large membrane associated protein, partial [Rhodoglobus sp.]|nr:large membrane associated protein [Rhodoglobus sp.]
VIDCATPHTGQLVHVGTFTDKAHADFPEVEELQKRIAILCTPGSIINYAVAGTMPDLQVSASFAPDAAEWVSGNRTYYCFVNRAANAPITGSVAVPQVPAPVAPAP